MDASPLDIVMIIFMASGIIGGGIWGRQFLNLPYRTRLIIAAVYTLPILAWIIGSHL